MPSVSVPANVAQAIINYLVARPYREVFQLIDALSAAPPTREGAPDETPTDER